LSRSGLAAVGIGIRFGSMETREDKRRRLHGLSVACTPYEVRRWYYDCMYYDDVVTERM